MRQLTLRSIVDIFRQTTSLVNHLPSLGCLPLLLFLQFLGGFFSQEKLEVKNVISRISFQPSAHPKFLLPLRGHEPLLALAARLLLQPLAHLHLPALLVAHPEK